MKTGRCIVCGKKLNDNRYRTCPECRERDRNYNRQRTQKKTPIISIDYLAKILKESMRKIGADNSIRKRILEQYEIDLEVEGLKVKKDMQRGL